MKHPAWLRYKTLHIHENNTEGIREKPNTLGILEITRKRQSREAAQSSRARQEDCAAALNWVAKKVKKRNLLHFLETVSKKANSKGRKVSHILS